MKERPIIFNGDMVRAILEGRKTMTRRPVKTEPGMESYLAEAVNNETAHDELYRYGKVGDMLWVRETWADVGRGLIYAADKKATPLKWKPSIHMPKWASRITLEITGIRIERVQEITEQDARKEGVWGIGEPYQGVGDLPADRFERLWQSIYGNWSDNPFCWVIKFRRVI